MYQVQPVTYVSGLDRSASSGGGGNRTRVQEASVLAFYTFSDHFNLAREALVHSIVPSQLLIFLSNARSAAFNLARMYYPLSNYGRVT